MGLREPRQAAACDGEDRAVSVIVERLDANELSVLQRDANRALMVAWINADLPHRAWCDVDKSTVLYDADRMFVYALDEVPDEFLLKQLREKTVIRHWSEGV